MLEVQHLRSRKRYEFNGLQVPGHMWRSFDILHECNKKYASKRVTESLGLTALLRVMHASEHVSCVRWLLYHDESQDNTEK